MNGDASPTFGSDVIIDAQGDDLEALEGFKQRPDGELQPTLSSGDCHSLQETAITHTGSNFKITGNSDAHGMDPANSHI